MKIAPTVRMIGSTGIIANVHAEFARKLIFANRAKPIQFPRPGSLRIIDADTGEQFDL